MNKETVQKNVYILHLNYRTVYCPKKALNCEMGNTVMANGNRFRAQCWWRSRLWALLGWRNGVFYWGDPVSDTLEGSLLPSTRLRGRNRTRQTQTWRSPSGPRRLRGAEATKEQPLDSFLSHLWLGWGFQSTYNLCLIHFLSMSFTHQKLLIVFTGPNVRFPLKVFDYLRSTTPFGGLGTVFVASWVISLFPESILWVKDFAAWRIWCGLSPDSWFSHKVLRRSSSN